MPNADNPLLHAIVASFHEPAPARAFRYRPFTGGTSRRSDGAVRPRFRLNVSWETFAALGRRVTLSPRSSPAACHAPACC